MYAIVNNWGLQWGYSKSLEIKTLLMLKSRNNIPEQGRLKETSNPTTVKLTTRWLTTDTQSIYHEEWELVSMEPGCMVVPSPRLVTEEEASAGTLVPPAGPFPSWRWMYQTSLSPPEATKCSSHLVNSSLSNSMLTKEPKGFQQKCVHRKIIYQSC